MKYRSSKLTRVSLNIENSVFSTGKDFFLLELDASYLTTMQEYLSIFQIEINLLKLLVIFYFFRCYTFTMNSDFPSFNRVVGTSFPLFPHFLYLIDELCARQEYK